MAGSRTQRRLGCREHTQLPRQAPEMRRLPWGRRKNPTAGRQGDRCAHGAAVHRFGRRRPIPFVQWLKRFAGARSAVRRSRRPRQWRPGNGLSQPQSSPPDSRKQAASSEACTRPPSSSTNRMHRHPCWEALSQDVATSAIRLKGGGGGGRSGAASPSHRCSHSMAEEGHSAGEHLSQGQTTGEKRSDERTPRTPVPLAAENNAHGRHEMGQGVERGAPGRAHPRDHA